MSLDNNILRNTSSRKILTFSTLFLICWYVLLCCVHYFTQRPLWNDEAAIFLSVEKFETLDFFTKKLENGQNFPHLYLCLVQKISKPFGFSLLSVRFLSFIFMLSAFFIWLKIIRYAIKDHFYYFIFVLTWCCSAQFVYYSAELKQYSMDVLSGGIFTLFLYNQKNIEEDPRRWRYGIVLVLPFTISYPT